MDANRLQSIVPPPKHKKLVKSLKEDKRDMENDLNVVISYFEPYTVISEANQAVSDTSGDFQEISSQSSTNEVNSDEENGYEIMNNETVVATSSIDISQDEDKEIANEKSINESNTVEKEVVVVPNRSRSNRKSIGRRSFVWNHFTPVERGNRFATCNECNKKVSSHGNTSNLKQHLLRNHSTILVQPQNQENDTKASSKVVKLLTTTDLARKRSGQPNKKRSFVWEYFTKNDAKFATCDICNKILSNCGNTTNLKSHLLRQHALEQTKDPAQEDGYEISMMKCETVIGTSSIEMSQDEDQVVTDGESINESNTVEKEVVAVPNRSRTNRKSRHRRSFVWNHFTPTKSGNRFATCNECNKKVLSHGNTTNLKQHLLRNHDRLVAKRLDTTDVTRKRSGQPKNKRSFVWDYFTRNDAKFATCDICNKRLSNCGNTTNLKEHLLRKHALEPTRDPIQEVLQDDSISFKKNEHISDTNESPEMIEDEVEEFLVLPGRFKKNDLSTNDKIQHCKIQSKISTHRNIRYLSENYLKDHSNKNSTLTVENGTQKLSEAPTKKKNQKRSLVWNHFTSFKGEKQFARCNECRKLVRCNGNTTNLQQHLRSRHRLKLEESETRIENEVVQEEIEGNVDLQIALKERRSGKPRSFVWNHFTRDTMEGQFASCKKCDRVISCSSTSNLKDHLKRKHSLIETGKEHNYRTSGKNFTSKNDFLIWNHFTKIKGVNKYAKCKKCKTVVSFKLNTSLLQHHLVRKHQLGPLEASKPSKQPKNHSGSIIKIDSHEVMGSTEHFAKIDKHVLRSSNKQLVTQRTEQDKLLQSEFEISHKDKKSTKNQTALTSKKSSIVRKHFVESKDEINDEVDDNDMPEIDQFEMIQDDIKELDTKCQSDGVDMPEIGFCDNQENMEKSKRDSVFNHFSIFAKCHLCEELLPFDGSTSNLQEHLNSHENVDIVVQSENVNLSVVQNDMPNID